MIDEVQCTLIPIQQHSLKNDINYKKLMDYLQDSKFVECKRDGNCMYRAVAFQIFPYLQYFDFSKDFFDFAISSKKAGFHEIVYDTYVESIEDILKTKSKIEELTEDDMTLLISYLRLICSTEALVNKEKYQGFIEEDIERYCKVNIDPLYQRAGDFEISVLSTALKMRIVVISLVDFTVQEISYGEGTRQIVLLHTPDHFEPIFRGDDSNEIIPEMSTHAI